MTEDQIKHMVDRFLQWKLPENFSPDAGISFKAAFNEHTAHPMKHAPTGTNLFDAAQATEMVRFMLEGKLALSASRPVGEVEKGSITAYGDPATTVSAVEGTTAFDPEREPEDDDDFPGGRDDLEMLRLLNSLVFEARRIGWAAFAEGSGPWLDRTKFVITLEKPSDGALASTANASTGDGDHAPSARFALESAITAHTGATFIEVETADPEALGQVVWHSSEEEGGPDVGLSLGLGEGRMLWLGEMSTTTLEDHGIDIKETGDGWWFVLYGTAPRDTEVAAIVVNQESARAVFDQLEVLARKAALSSAKPAEGDRSRDELNPSFESGEAGWREISEAKLHDEAIVWKGVKLKGGVLNLYAHAALGVEKWFWAGDDSFGELYFQPTHFHPLPAPPSPRTER